MLKLFQHKPCSWLGIDISSTSVNLVELSNKPGDVILQTYASAAFANQAIDSGVIKDGHIISDSIARLLDTHHFSSKKVTLAIPDAISISKLIEVSADLQEHEIEEWVMLDVDRHIPYSLDEIYLDFQILGSSAHHLDKLDVLLVASKIQNVQQRVEVIERAGLIADVVEIESHAIMRAMAETSLLCHQKTSVVIDLREQSICYFVFQGRTLVFLREEPVDNNEVHPNKEEPFLLQIKRVLQFYLSTTNQTQIDYFLLAGKSVKSQEFILLLQSHFNIPTQYVNPFINIKLSNRVNPVLFNESCSRLLVAYGLALRGTKGVKK